MEGRRVAIAGCGPAGLAAALFLARAGWRVTLFERFAAPRPVGSGLILQPPGLAVLAALGLAERVQALGAPLRRLYGRSVPSGRIVLDVRYDALGPSAAGLGVHRAALFDALHEAARGQGDITIRCGVEAAGLARFAGGVGLIDAQGGRHGVYDLVIDAMGARSPLLGETRFPLLPRPLAFGALWATLPWPGAPFDPQALEQRYRGASEMAGVLPIGALAAGGPPLAAYFWSLRAADFDRWRAAGLDAWRAKARALWPQTAPLLDAIGDPQTLVFARYAHHTMREPFGDAVAHIGDAAHATSPQLGQGANMALLDAAALAAALAARPDIGAALRLYAALRRRHVRLYQAASAVFTPFYQSDSRVLAALRDRLAAPLSRLRGVDALLARLVAGVIIAPQRANLL